MKKEILEGSENYTCQVIKLPIKQEVKGLDNLVKVTYQGNVILTSKDADRNIKYLFFPAECQISHEFLSANNLYRHSELNVDKTKSGFFEDNRRVKALKFKGVVSTGFIIPYNALMYLYPVFYAEAKDYLKVGDEFNSIDGVEICRKYVKKLPKENSLNKQDKKVKFDKLLPNQFRFHESTSHLAKNLHLFSPESLIVITDKWHGTSAVFSNVLIRKNLTLVEKILKYFGVNIQDKVYDNLYSSRTVIKNRYINANQNLGYYNEDIWKTVNDELVGKIQKGITIYGEIVGFLESGKYIQKGYDYSCSENQHKFIVYRITYTNVDGDVLEFSWQQIKDYCAKYSLETVKELYYGQAGVFHSDKAVEDTRPWNERFFDLLSSVYLEKDCKYCVNSVPQEGICVRIDGKDSYSTYKLKSKRFIKRESEELDTQEVNIEEEA